MVKVYLKLWMKTIKQLMFDNNYYDSIYRLEVNHILFQITKVRIIRARMVFFLNLKKSLMSILMMTVIVI